MHMAFRPLLDRRFHGECPLWDDRRKKLFFVDMAAPAVHAVRLDGTGLETWPVPETVGSIGLGESGRLLVSQPSSLLLLDPDSGELKPFIALQDVPTACRLNDGKTGPDGAFWVGSMDGRKPRAPVASLYRIDSRGSVSVAIDGGLLVSNGLAWTADGTFMFHSDSGGPWIDRYRFSPATGEISERTRIATPEERVGRPDGGACDMDDCYWSAGVSSGRINIWSTSGDLLDFVEVPTPAPSMPAFCGEDLRSLVVTSLRNDDPESGKLLITTAPRPGAAVGRWQDGAA